MNILISVLLFSAFGFAQTTPACFQVWEAQNEFNAVYGMWEPKEFHSNGLPFGSPLPKSNSGCRFSFRSVCDPHGFDSPSRVAWARGGTGLSLGQADRKHPHQLVWRCGF